MVTAGSFITLKDGHLEVLEPLELARNREIRIEIDGWASDCRASVQHTVQVAIKQAWSEERQRNKERN